MKIVVKRYGIVDEKQVELAEAIEGDDFEQESSSLLIGRRQGKEAVVMKMYAPGEWISAEVKGE